MPKEVEQAEFESTGAKCFTLMPAEGSLQKLSVKTRSHSHKTWNLLSHSKEKCHRQCNSFDKCIYQNVIHVPFLIKEKSWSTGKVILTVTWPASGRVFNSKAGRSFLFLQLLLALSFFLLIIGLNVELLYSDGQSIPFLIYTCFCREKYKKSCYQNTLPLWLPQNALLLALFSLVSHRLLQGKFVERFL